MKLPLPNSRKAKLLDCFLVGPMTLDDLIAKFGLFQCTRDNLRRALHDLTHERLLANEGGTFSLPEAVRLMLNPIRETAQVVPPRKYEFKPLDPSILHDRSMRRTSTLDRVNAAHYSA